MTEIPHAVLSEHFQERMQKRRLHSAVFLTYQFDPGFFEQEVLPVFVDIPVSHATVIRLVQLEDALRSLPGHLAVYYDANGLVVGDAGSAKLDMRRVPVQHRKGYIFHPKNVFLLVEAAEPDDQGYRPQTLIIASLSANLTRSGWWENVEACHVEEIAEGEKTRLKDDLAQFLESVRQKAKGEREHAALRNILAFLKCAGQRHQKTASGSLHTHFYSGSESVPDFLDRIAGEWIRKACLEVISPYFDDAAECTPLRELIDRFAPREVRVFLPRSAAGEALCRQELYDSVKQLPGVHWGRLPKELVRLGRREEAGERFVHAKIYRFFTQNPKREICFVGSANLTSAAHQLGGNVETGFIVDMPTPHRPAFWLAPDEREPLDFLVRREDEGAAAGGTRLNLRYHWDQAIAKLYWDAPGASPVLRIEARGILLGEIPSLPSRTWMDAATEVSLRVGEILHETSLFTVYGDGETPALLLVQEEDMSHKPSLLLQLSTADILRYWSLLTPEQRAAFIDSRAPEIARTGLGADLVTKAKFALEHDTLFDRFAGFFHAFGCLERAVRSALQDKQTKAANYRLFGKKYDSLGSLLDRVLAEDNFVDGVDRYVIVMCARQLCQEIARDFPDYWSQYTTDAKALVNRFADLSPVREDLIKQNGEGFAEFLDWFDRWFLRRAKSLEVEP